MAESELEQALNVYYFDMTINELRLMNSLRNDNISYNSLLYLDIIAYKENCTASYIADALGIAKSAVSVKINELISEGLVEKTQSETDKRIFYLTVPECARRKYKRYDRILRQTTEKIEKEFSCEEIDNFCNMLRQIGEVFAGEVERERLNIKNIENRNNP